MAGTDDSQVTRSRQLIRLTSGSTLELLKSRKILISFDLASLLLENKINFVFAGCRASLRDLKKSEIFLNSRLTLAMSESRSGSDTIITKLCRPRTGERGVPSKGANH